MTPETLSDPSPSRDPAEILAERLRIVLDLTDANAAHRLAQSRAGGAQLDVMTLKNRADEAEAGAPIADIEAELEVAHARDAAARLMMSESEARIAALDARLDALDRELAGADR